MKNLLKIFILLMCISMCANGIVVSTKKTYDGGKIVLDRYRNMVTVAVETNSTPTNGVQCYVYTAVDMHAQTEINWIKLRKIDDKHYFGKVRTQNDLFAVRCLYDSYILSGYSIHAHELKSFEPFIHDSIYGLGEKYLYIYPLP
jgi:hypothetical protein